MWGWHRNYATWFPRNDRTRAMRLRNRARWIVWIATTRVFTFVIGWVLTVHYADWRQVVGYPIILVGALPDALFVRYVIRPQSLIWPYAMVVSLLVSSALLGALVARSA